MNFITVKEREYNDTIELNLDNVISVHELSGTVITNGVICNDEGHTMQLIYNFDKENMTKIMKYISNTRKSILLNE